MKPYTVVGIGETLWDVFPDAKHFGGAPANFACSAAQLLADDGTVYMVSRVGDDELGNQARVELQNRRVLLDNLTTAPFETGRVDVQIDPNGNASYRFASDVAWDHLQPTSENIALAKRADAVCFGTLGQRCTDSQLAISEFVRNTRPDCLRVFDINLRPPYWSESVILDSLASATILKLNDSELPVVAKLLSLQGDTEHQLHQLIDRYPLLAISLTMGEHGALIIDSEHQVYRAEGTSVAVVDTVGAGDAYTAALVTGVLRGQSWSKINSWATRVAAYVCTQKGATPTFPDNLSLPF